MADRPIRIVLAEDNVLVREGAKRLLESTGAVDIVGTASDAVDAARLVDQTSPDAVVTDIRMPPGFRIEGIELAHAIRRSHPGTGVVVLSSHHDPEYALALFEHGTAGIAYLLKERVADPEHLLHAVRAVVRGDSVIDPAVVDALAGHGTSGLTPHEQRQLDLMRAGASYESMAQTLGIPPPAVDAGVSAVLAKLALAASKGSAGAISELRKLHDGVVDQRQSAAAMSKYLSPQVARVLAAGATAPPSEVDVSVLFTDVRGYTALAESNDPGTLRTQLDEHLGAMSEVVFAHDGIVDGFVGDSVMAVFGAPEPADDHARRAVDCARAMLGRQALLNERWLASGLPPFSLGVGINTGKAMAGVVAGAKLDYTVVGDTVNVSQRLCSLAAPDEIVLSTATAAGAGLEGEEVHEVSVKGRRRRVPVVRLSDVPGRGT